MKISVCIPCEFNHIHLLSNAIQSIINSSLLPDEICISISGVKGRSLPDFYLPNNIQSRVVISDQTRNAGSNRNELVNISSNDILVFHDADDLMHPSRLELLEYVFRTTDLLHLNTAFSEISHNDLNQISKENISLTDLRLTFLDKYHHLIFPDGLESGYRTRDYGWFNGFHFPERSSYIANGPTAIRRSITIDTRWKEESKFIRIAEDQDFNYEVLFKYNKSGLIHNPIYYYCMDNRMGGGRF